MDGRGIVLWASHGATRTFNIGEGDDWTQIVRCAEARRCETAGSALPGGAGLSTDELLCADGAYRTYSIDQETVTIKPTRVRVKLTLGTEHDDSGAWLPAMISATEVIARAPMPFVLTDLDGNVFGANKALRILLGAERLPRSLSTHFHPDDWEMLIGAARQQSSVAPVHPEVRLLAPGCRETWVRVVAALVSGESQLIWQFVDVTEDRSARLRTERRLRRMTEITQTLQRAILPPLPPQIGSLKVVSAYRSAASDAQVGGDLFGAADTRWGSRFIIGDVRGKGLDAVGIASHTLERFTLHSATTRILPAVAEKVDEDLGHFDLASEGDFVTAVLAEVNAMGRLMLVGCGHPDPWLIRDGVIHTLELERTVPLGLGSRPRPVTVDLQPGDRVALFTDGLLEARNADGSFIDPRSVGRWMREKDLRACADGLLRTISRSTTRDDVACVMFEYRPAPRRGWR